MKIRWKGFPKMSLKRCGPFFKGSFAWKYDRRDFFNCFWRGVVLFSRVHLHGDMTEGVSGNGFSKRGSPWSGVHNVPAESAVLMLLPFQNMWSDPVSSLVNWNLCQQGGYQTHSLDATQRPGRQTFQHTMSAGHFSYSDWVTINTSVFGMGGGGGGDLMIVVVLTWM